MRIPVLILAASMAAFASGNLVAADAQNGKQVFLRWCQGCHEALPGTGFDPPAGTYTLQQHYQGSLPAEIEKRNDLTAAQIKDLVRHGVNVMTPFRKTEITDRQLDDLIAYLVKP
jgi:(+)-pinoresinol hydroxylase